MFRRRERGPVPTLRRRAKFDLEMDFNHFAKDEVPDKTAKFISSLSLYKTSTGK